jgi:hypothetical protein
MTIAMERILAWKILPRVMMAVMCYAYLDVLNWFTTLPPEAMTSQATALTATVTSAMTGAFAVWLGDEKWFVELKYVKLAYSGNYLLTVDVNASVNSHFSHLRIRKKCFNAFHSCSFSNVIDRVPVLAFSCEN